MKNFLHLDKLAADKLYNVIVPLLTKNNVFLNENFMLFSDNSSMRILIVEDEAKLVKYLKKGLEQEGYTVDTCFTGEEAEQFVSLHHELLDIIILDQMLPLKSGNEICISLRMQHITTPILMLTAKDTSRDIIVSLDAGVDDYVTKPFSLEVLLARLRALLRRPKILSATSQEIRIGDIVLQIASRKVYCKRKELLLTLKEFNLLEYLMKHKNKVLDREQLLEKVWDVNFDSFSNVVDVHIRNIRKKLEQVHHADILETVRGVGYRIKE